MNHPLTVKLLRLWLLMAFVLLVLTSRWLAPRVEAQPGTVKLIAPGVWFREGEQPMQAKSNEMKDSGHCNNVFIEMEDYLIVVDANFPSGAKLALADAQKISSKPVRYVFDTHHHADHAYGNPIWTRIGAITLAHQGVVEAMRRVEPRRWLETAAAREDVRELNLPSAQPPLETFSESPHVLSDETRRVEFHHFGWGHTRGDGFVYLPEEKILCTGGCHRQRPIQLHARCQHQELAERRPGGPESRCEDHPSRPRRSCRCQSLCQTDSILGGDLSSRRSGGSSGQDIGRSGPVRQRRSSGNIASTARGPKLLGPASVPWTSAHGL